MGTGELDRELRQVLLDLEMISQVSGLDEACVVTSASKSAEEPGGKRPPGGIDHAGDREPDYPQKSVEYFRRRLAKTYGDAKRELVLAEAEEALEACRRIAAPTKENEPAYGSPQWKRYVAESDESHGKIAGRFGVTRAYIQQIRKKYGAEALDAT